MHGAVVQHFVVNLIGENHQLVLASNLDDFQQEITTVNRTGWVIGVDQHNATGFGVILLRISSRSGYQSASSSQM